MTIQEIKEQFGFSTLMMVRQLTLSGQRTSNGFHIGTMKRKIRLSIRENIAELIKNKKSYDKLDYEVHEIEQKGEKPYTRIIIMIEDNSWRRESEFDSSYDIYNAGSWI